MAPWQSDRTWDDCISRCHPTAVIHSICHGQVVDYCCFVHFDFFASVERSRLNTSSEAFSDFLGPAVPSEHYVSSLVARMRMWAYVYCKTSNRGCTANLRQACSFWLPSKFHKYDLTRFMCANSLILHTVPHHRQFTALIPACACMPNNGVSL